MADEAANPIDLDLNLGPIPEPDDALFDRLLDFEEFIVNRRRGRLIRPREVQQPVGQSNSLDLLRESFNPGDIQQAEQFGGLNQLRERYDREMLPISRADPHVRARLRMRELHLARQIDAVNRNREILPIRARPHNRSLWRHSPGPTVTTRTVHMEMMANPDSNPSSSFLSGETSVTLPEREAELLKVSENNNEINVGNEEVSEKGSEDKVNDDDKGSFFDCNICLDLAKDPVVTCCGHLFCWPCIYQWLNIHSVANECPVCKGEVTMKNVIPIYGRGSIPHEHDPPGHQIPVRPHAQRVESIRQTILRSSVSTSIEEMVRHLGERSGRAWRDRFARAADVAVPRNTSSERIGNYFIVRGDREEPPPPLDDRDSVSSIAAIIQSESQTIDTALEIDSNVSLSTSTSRRRNRSDVSRASDVDSGDSRTHRRRLN